VASEFPIIVGVGQITNRSVDAQTAKEPLELMEMASKLAETDAGAGALLAKVDSVQVVGVLSWPSAAPAVDLAAQIDARPAETLYTTIGGNTPQSLVNETAERIVRGDIRLALLAGADAVHSLRLAGKRGEQLSWADRGQPATNWGDGRPGSNELEGRHGATMPIHFYPFFENALRAHQGRSIEDHQRHVGELWASFAAVAGDNEHAWFRDAKTADEIATVSAKNRMVCFPYTKYMNAMLEVDQGAALLMTSTSVARELGIPEERWVYLLGCGDAVDRWWVSERANYHSSPAIRVAGSRALGMAGVGIDDIAYFDLYSCFPSAVQLGRDALGIAPEDPRPLTVTGGLAYFGGPGNNYTMHSIAQMVELLREDRDHTGLVTGLGWYATKHSVGVYGTRPPAGAWERTDTAVDQAALDKIARPEVIDAADGAATVETYTVVHDREGRPQQGIVIGRLRDERRFVANTPNDTGLLESMTTREFVGEQGTVRHDASTNTNTFTP
jgi:acetyl-CoA C-acetyltransferase